MARLRVTSAEVAMRDVMVAAQRVQWDSALTEAIECQWRRKTEVAQMHFNNGAGPSDHADG
jgi:hypothetical protein